MRLETNAFTNGDRIPDQYAMFIPADVGHAQPGANRNPELRWSEFPEATRSFALIAEDPDAPSVGDDVNQEGRTVPVDLPRASFFHWVMVDIPASVSSIAEAADSDGVTPKGKSTGATDLGIRGKNDYTGWFEGDEAMGGTYGGYDGPAPPWNDERIHRYFFRVYALDIESLGLSGDFGAHDVLEAMEGHVLDQAEISGTYTLNPDKR